MLGMAYAGLLFTASPEQDEPFAPPGATNDVLTGTMIAFGVLAALLQRQQSGHGETVHASLLHTALWTQLIQLGTAANAPQVLVPPRSRREPRSPGVNQYKCSDGRWIAVAAVTAGAWASFTQALDLDFTDPETGGPLSYAGVLAHAAEVRETLDEYFAKQPMSHWLARLEAAGVWCTPVNTLADVMTDEQVSANGYLSTLDDGLRTVAMPFTLSGYAAPARAARRPGEDDDDVLGGPSGRLPSSRKPFFPPPDAGGSVGRAEVVHVTSLNDYNLFRGDSVAGVAQTQSRRQRGC
jgi:crotonobetainyl-CoA:carnitine CoA-transferase CaiB-like acyl-CoA transferase